MIILSCGIKISAVCSIDPSQVMRVTDGWTELRSPQDRASMAALRGKNDTHIDTPCGCYVPNTVKHYLFITSYFLM